MKNSNHAGMNTTIMLLNLATWVPIRPLACIVHPPTTVDRCHPIGWGLRPWVEVRGSVTAARFCLCHTLRLDGGPSRT